MSDVFSEILFLQVIQSGLQKGTRQPSQVLFANSRCSSKESIELSDGIGLSNRKTPPEVCCSCALCRCPWARWPWAFQCRESGASRPARPDRSGGELTRRPVGGQLGPHPWRDAPSSKARSPVRSVLDELGCGPSKPTTFAGSPCF